MRNVDDGVPLRLQAAQQREETLHVSAPEAARRLVEHQHPAADRERAGDLDELLRGHRERADRRVGRNVVVPEIGQRAAGQLAHARTIEHAVSRGLRTEQNVLHHGEVRRERQLLINHRDACAAALDRAARRVRLAVN